MEFKKITPKEFIEFSAKHPCQCFMQSPGTAELCQQNGWKPSYLAVKNEHGKILAATLLVSKPSFLGKYQTFCTPGGPLLDFKNSELTQFFFAHLKKYAYHRHGFVLNIDPFYELIERDRCGHPVDGGFNHEKALRNLESLGFRPFPRATTPKYLFVLELTANGQPKIKDAVWADFSQSTRRCIRRAAKMGVRVRELQRSELPLLPQLVGTAARQGFVDGSLRCYEQLYDIFHPLHAARFLVAEADIDGVTTPLSAAMFMLTGKKEIVYLHAGSDARYRKSHNAHYAIQWHIIQFALEQGFSRYNFYGLLGLPDPSSPGYEAYRRSPAYGAYNFKKGFGGHVVELIGSFQLPIRPHLFRLHSAASSLKNLLPH